MINVPGGTIELVEPYHTHEEGRPLRHHALARSDHEGKSATFMDPKAAEFWLWAINERVVGRLNRLGEDR